MSEANALVALDATSALAGPSTRKPLTNSLGLVSVRQSYPSRHQKTFWV